MGVALVFQLIYKGFTRLLLVCHKCVHWLLHGCVNGVTSVFKGVLQVLHYLMMLQGCY